MELEVNNQIEQQPVPKTILSKVPLRKIVQFFVVALMLIAAWQFYGFVDYLRSGGSGTIPERPPVVEGFLPIAAFVAFKAFLATGEIDPIHPAGLVILIATLVTAWLFRRALCSWICPIGTLSEYLAKIGQKIMGKNLTIPKWLDFILLGIKYAIFIFITRAFFLMSADDAIGFMQIPYYAVSDIKMFDMFVNLSSTGLIVIAVLMVLSVLIKSFWCRYLCPYGAFLGIVSFFSPFVLTKNTDTCINCGLCNKACPNRVDVAGTKKIVATTECTGCTSCTTVCPRKDTLQFKLLGLSPVRPLIFSAAFLVVFWGFIVWAKMTGHWESVLTFSDYQMLEQIMARTGF